MALKTDMNPNKNLVCNGEFSSYVQNGQILLLNEPVMIYKQENMEIDDCTVVPINNENNSNLKLPGIVFDGNYFHFENVQNGNLPNNYGLHENYQYLNERQRVDDGLAVLEILCNDKAALEQPEYVDISKLSDLAHIETSKTTDVLCISDEEEVVFVREYKEDKREKKVDNEISKAVEKTVKKEVVSPKTNSSIRRNPVRKVRINSKKLSKEHILEEDFALLDDSDEEKVEEKENREPNKRPAPNSEVYKQWPVNAHERPEYNTETKQIEAFDYTIREIQKKAPNKKPRLESVPVKKKSKKKYFTRKRKPRVIPVKKIPIGELKSLVNSTTESLKEFFDRSKELRQLLTPGSINMEICSVQNKLDIFKNQIILYSLVNDFDANEVMKKLEPCITENEKQD